MKLNKFFLFLSFVSILFLFVFALPNFNLKIKDTPIDFKGLDFSSVIPGAVLGNFQRGYGIFPSNEISAKLNFEDSIDLKTKNDKLIESYKVIKERLRISDLYDVKIFAENDNDQQKITLEFPQYYSNPRRLAEWIFRSGVITFSPNPQNTTTTTIDLKDSDIEGGFSLDYLAQPYGTHLVAKFKDDALNIFRDAVNNAQGFFLMNIDSVPAFLIAAHDTKTDQARFIPAEASTDSRERIILLNLTKALFNEKQPLDQKFTIDENVIKLSPLFSYQGGSLIGIVIILISAFIALFLFIKKGKKKASIILLMTFASMILHIGVLKIFSANLSVYLVIGVLLILVLTLLISINLTETDVEHYKKSIIENRELAYFIVILCTIIYLLNAYATISIDVLGAIIIGGLVLLFSTYTYFPIFYQLKFIEIKLPFLKK